jgi:hypothetical protein
MSLAMKKSKAKTRFIQNFLPQEVKPCIGKIKTAWEAGKRAGRIGKRAGRTPLMIIAGIAPGMRGDCRRFANSCVAKLAMDRGLEICWMYPGWQGWLRYTWKSGAIESPGLPETDARKLIVPA